jgi:hypothetical protein
MPVDPQIQLMTTQSPRTQAEFVAMRDIPYHEAVGLLMYLSLGTCPDITYAVGIVSTQNSTTSRARLTGLL